MFNIDEELKKLPERSGVYLMKDNNGTVIYVGKAKILKNRVRQYFKSQTNNSPKVQAMVEKIDSFEYIVTDTEVEALILECTLIKKYKPHYNILLKDDKTYPYIKITMKEKYPRVIMTRKVVKDGSMYYGPYTEVGAVRDTMEILKKLFPLKLCNKIFLDNKEYVPCLHFHIRQCVGPCRKELYREQYMEIVKDLISFLEGRQEEVAKRLQEQMLQASERFEYEKAADIRDKINSLKIISQKQKMVTDQSVDQDVLAVAKNNTDACVEVFFVRGGKLLGRESFIFEGKSDMLEEELLQSFIVQFYNRVASMPPRILLQHELEENELIEEWIERKCQQKVKLIVPKRGEKYDLVKLVYQNAQLSLERFQDRMRRHDVPLQMTLRRLADKIGIKEIPQRIEAYDISNTGVSEMTGSMVVFTNGVADKKEYKRFKIKWNAIQNDYLCMREIIYRRLRRAETTSEDSSGFSKLPDLIFVDGGKQHVNVVKSVLEDLSIYIPVWGMVKDDKHRTRGLTTSELEISLATDINLLRFVTSIQDEAHRFALEYNKLLREKRYRKSALDEISGVGPKKKRNLIKVFGSVNKIRAASIEELCLVEGITKDLAEKIQENLKQ